MRKLLALLLSACCLFAAEPDFTILVLPDTQYQIQTCSPQLFNVMANWIVTNRNANLGTTDQGVNLTLNTKAVLGVGDITQVATSGEFARGAGSATSAYGIFDANTLPVVLPAGNHDWVDGSTHATASAGFTPPGTVSFANCSGVAGFFSASCREVHGYFGGGATYGGKYDEVNYYVKLVVGSLKFLVFSIEYVPRAVVLSWAKDTQDANYGWTAIVLTHGFLASNATLSRFQTEPGVNGYNDDVNNAGLSAPVGQNTSDTGLASGYGMWNGAGGAASATMSGWGQLGLVLNGHFLSNETSWAASPTNYLYQTLPLTSASSRGQTVQSIFVNYQDLDGGVGSSFATWVAAGNAPPDVSTYCTASNWGPYRLAHVMVLQFRPSLGKVEGYVVTTSMNKWEPTFANRIAVAPSATPQRLFSISYAAAKRPIFPMGMAVGPQ